MLKKFSKNWGFERDNAFVNKVLLLCFPNVLVFTILAAYRQIEPIIAVAVLACVALFNTILLFPLSCELQKIKRYVAKLSSGEVIEGETLKMSEKETKELVNAINNMHKFWAEKNDVIKAKSLSDAAVLDSLPDPLMVIDHEGMVIGANLSARQALGEEITHKKIDEIFNSHNFLNAVSRVLNKESSAETLVFYANEPLASKFYAHIKLLPWQKLNQTQVVIAIYDLTKSLKIEKMQSDFVANASHELRTPLSVITSFVETLRTSAKDDEQAREQFLEIIAEQADYMSNLIEKLLSLSRIELIQDEEPGEEVNVRDLVYDIKKTFVIKAKERHMTIKVFADKDLVNAKGDEQQVRQVLQNLIDNAVKYGDENSQITIRIKNVDKIPTSKTIKTSEGRAVAIAVNNKGAKIAPENLARLTERFYRLQEHKDKKIKGTGLGLAIIKHIIIRHRGNITVNSTGDNGTTFTVYLPVFVKN